MKRSLFLWGMAFLCIYAFAQEERDWTSNIDITIKAGIGSTGFTSSVEQSRSSIAFRTGVSADIPFSHKIGLQPSLFYTYRGDKIKEPTDINCRLSYIDLPVLFCFYDVIDKNNDYFLPEGPIMKWKIGPYIGYKLNGDVKNANAPTKKFDFGVSGGMDVIINHIVFSGEVSVGAIPVCKDYNGHRLHNMTLVLSLGYKL